MIKRVLLVCATVVTSGFGLPTRAQTVHDRAQLEEFVRLCFPHAKVTRLKAPKEEHPNKFFHDSRNFYEVVAPVEPGELQYATGVLDPNTVSTRRLVQAKVSARRMPSAETIYVVSLNYSFQGVPHPDGGLFTCRLGLIRRANGGWEVKTRDPDGVNPVILNVDFQDLSGNATPELLTTIDNGTMRWQGAWLFIFDISNRTLDRFGSYQIDARSAYSGLSAETGTIYRKELNVSKTRATGGRQLIFRVATFVRDGRLLQKPEMTEEAVVPGAPDRK
jgi:hypothetical protein